MNENKNKSGAPEENIIGTIWYKFFPFWPLFVLLAIVFLSLAFCYLLLEKPSYRVTATLVISSDQNQTNNNQAFQTLNAFATSQVVDNEVLVLQSRSLMTRVVNSLHLYAPLFNKETLFDASAYLSSPIVVEAREPDKLKRETKVSFEFNDTDSSVLIDDKSYPLNQWVTFPFGTIRFLRNPRNDEPKEGEYYFTLEDPTVVASGLLNSLEVSSVSKLATAINVSFKAEVPERGEDVVNELLQQYLLVSIENENVLAANTLAFVEERLQDVEQELDSVERRIEAFRSAEGAIDLSEQSRIYLQNVAENDRKIADIDAQLAVLDQVDRYVNSPDQRTGIIPTTLGIEDPVLAQLLQRLNELELQLAALKATTGADHPLVESIESEIQKIRPNIRSIVNNQSARLQASRNNFTNTSNRFNNLVRSIPQQERELLEISRQQAVKTDLYAFLLQRKEEAALSTASSIADNRVVDWADASVAAKISKKIIAALGSIILAFGLGLGYVLFKEELSKNVLFRSEVEKLTSFPVVSEILFRKRLAKLSEQLASDAVITKELNQLQAALGLYDENSKKKTFLITSSIQNEGASFISNHFAMSLAQTGKRVLLMDLDLNNPETSALHQLKINKGFSDYVNNQINLDNSIYSSKFPDLDVMPAGSKGNNSMQLLITSKADAMFQNLKSMYDYIVIDTPPLELSSDAYALSSHSDCTLMVIRHDVTLTTTVKQLDSNIKLKSFKELKIILNGIKPRGFPRRYVGYGFGYGYETVPKKEFAEG